MPTRSPHGSEAHATTMPHPLVQLSNFLILSELGMHGPRTSATRTCKVREKPHRDVPPFMDDMEPVFALKCIDLDDHVSPESRQRALQEMQTLLTLQHPNIVQYVNAFLYEGGLCYMTEFADCKSLHRLVCTAKERGQRLATGLIWHLFTQICYGLKRLHDAGLVHHALKTRNLLLFHESLHAHPSLRYRCKLADLAVPELQRHLRLASLDGSRVRYLAPEILRGEPGGTKADIWALGCVLYEMLTLSHAFHATSAILAGEYKSLPPDAPIELRDLIASIFQVDPARRPTVDELLLVPSVAACAAEMPNPVLLDERHADHLTGTGAAAKQAAACPGVAVWAKQQADGLWHRGVVHSAVDADCCLVHFVEKGSVELVWHDDLRALLPAPPGGVGVRRSAHHRDKGAPADGSSAGSLVQTAPPQSSRASSRAGSRSQFGSHLSATISHVTHEKRPSHDKERNQSDRVSISTEDERVVIATGGVAAPTGHRATAPPSTADGDGAAGAAGAVGSAGGRAPPQHNQNRSSSLDSDETYAASAFDPPRLPGNTGAAKPRHSSKSIIGWSEELSSHGSHAGEDGAGQARAMTSGWGSGGGGGLDGGMGVDGVNGGGGGGVDGGGGGVRSSRRAVATEDDVRRHSGISVESGVSASGALFRSDASSVGDAAGEHRANPTEAPPMGLLAGRSDTADKRGSAAAPTADPVTQARRRAQPVSKPSRACLLM